VKYTATIDKYVARLLMVCFFLPTGVQSVIMFTFAFYFFFRSLNEGYRATRRDLLMAAVLGGGYLLYLINYPFADAAGKAEIATMLEHRATLLLMPFTFAFISPKLRLQIKEQLRFFVYGTLIACLVANVCYVIHYIQSGQQTLSHVDYRIYFEDITDLHPTYISMYLCFSVCILLLTYRVTGQYARAMKYIFLMACFVFLLPLLAKAPIIALGLILIHYFFTHRKALKKQIIIALVALCIIIPLCFVIPFTAQRIQEVTQFAHHSKTGNAENNSLYARQMIWDADMSLLRDNWVCGVGPGRLQPMLNEKFAVYSKEHNIPVAEYGCHNEYITQWLSFGLIGIVVFVCVLGVQFVRAYRRHNLLYSYLLVIVSVTFFTETLLSREHGVTFYAIFTGLLFFIHGLEDLTTKGTEGTQSVAVI